MFKIKNLNYFGFFVLFYLFMPRFWNLPLGIEYKIDFPKLVSLISLVMFVFFLMLQKIKLPRDNISKLFYLILFFLFISVFYSPKPFVSFLYFFIEVCMVYIFYLYGFNNKSVTSSINFQKLLFFITILMLFFALFEFITEYNIFAELSILYFGNTAFGDGGDILILQKELGRPVNLWLGTSIDVAQIVFSLLFLSLLSYEINPSITNKIAVFSSLTIIILAQSRAVYLGVFLFFLIYNYSKSKNFYKLIILLVFCSLFTVYFFLTENLFYQTFIEGNEYTSLAMRFYGLIVSFEIIQNNILGFGYAVCSKITFATVLRDAFPDLLLDKRFDWAMPFVYAIESGIITAVMVVSFYISLIIKSFKIFKITNNKINLLYFCYFIIFPLVNSSTALFYSLFLYYFIAGNYIRNIYHENNCNRC